MQIRQLVDLVSFEAGILGVQDLGGFIGLTIRELLDAATQAQKYDELYVANSPVALLAATASVALPADMQHLDQKNIRLSPSGENIRAYILEKASPGLRNEGKTQYFFPTSNPLVLQLYPYGEIVAQDKLYINYWKKAPVWATLQEEFVPDVLLQTIKNRAVARVAASAGNPKLLAAAASAARDSFGWHMGAKDAKDCNGE